MKLYLTNSTNPYFNLAAEEYCLRYSDEDVFMLWQNEPSVIIGRNQNMYAEVDLSFTEPKGIHIARRITGGGAVYHDLGNVNYSFITSREKANVLDFAYFTRPIIKALGALNIKAALSGRNDLISETFDGGTAKFSGSAQTVTNDRILHHGTLLFDSDMTVLSRALKPDEEKLKSKAIKSVRSRVMNLRELVPDMTTAEFFEYLVTFAENEFETTRETVPEVDVLATGLYDRNASFDYNAGRRKTYEFSAKKRFASGIVVVLWDVADGMISDFRIEGDFFGESDAQELAAKLVGIRADEESMRRALQDTDVGNYISGVTNEDLIQLCYAK